MTMSMSHIDFFHRILIYFFHHTGLCFTLCGFFENNHLSLCIYCSLQTTSFPLHLHNCLNSHFQDFFVRIVMTLDRSLGHPILPVHKSQHSLLKPILLMLVLIMSQTALCSQNKAQLPCRLQVFPVHLSICEILSNCLCAHPLCFIHLEVPVGCCAQLLQNFLSTCCLYLVH